MVPRGTKFGPRPIEVRKKIAASKRGKTYSFEQRARIAEGQKRAISTGRVSVAQLIARGRRGGSVTASRFSGSKLEKFCESILRSLGISFVRQFRLPGNPHPFDFAIIDQKLLIEVDGCYWHGCDCRIRSKRASVAIDQRIDSYARSLGWIVLRFKECEGTIDWSLADAI